MSFGVSFNKSFRTAYQLAEQREAQEEQNQFDAEQRAKEIQEQRKQSLAELALPHMLKGTLGGAGAAVSGEAETGAAGAVAGSDEAMLAIKEIQTRYPDVSPEFTAQLYDYPQAAPSVRDKINEVNETWKNAYGENMPASEVEKMLLAINEVGGRGGLSEEKVNTIAKMFGVSPGEEYIEGSGITMGDMIESLGVSSPSYAPVIDEPASPLDTATKKYYQDVVASNLSGMLSENLRQLRELQGDPELRLESGMTEADLKNLHTRIASLENLQQQVEDGHLRPALDFMGPQVIQYIAEQYNDPRIYDYFPSYRPERTPPQVEVRDGVVQEPVEEEKLGVTLMPDTPVEPVTPPTTSGPPKITTVEEYNKLAPGTVYIDPNGIRRRK